jgi:aarF domain-containing kinase
MGSVHDNVMTQAITAKGQSEEAAKASADVPPSLHPESTSYVTGMTQQPHTQESQQPAQQQALPLQSQQQQPHVAPQQQQQDSGSQQPQQQQQPKKKKVMRERRVPESPFGRALGFAGLGASLLFGTMGDNLSKVWNGPQQVGQ